MTLTKFIIFKAWSLEVARALLEQNTVWEYEMLPRKKTASQMIRCQASIKQHIDANLMVSNGDDTLISYWWWRQFEIWYLWVTMGYPCTSKLKTPSSPVNIFWQWKARAGGGKDFPILQDISTWFVLFRNVTLSQITASFHKASKWRSFCLRACSMPRSQWKL